MHVVDWRRPVPKCDYAIAFHADGPLRLARRQLALGDSIGPIGKQRQVPATPETIRSCYWRWPSSISSERKGWKIAAAFRTVGSDPYSWPSPRGSFARAAHRRP